MELRVRCWGPLGLALVLVQWAWPSFCLTVEFPSKEPVSVALGQTLVLEAKIIKTSEEKLRNLEWYMEVKGRPGQTGSKFRVYPPARNARVSVEREGATLRVTNLSKEDYGNYTITVTDNDGLQASACRIVRESEVTLRVSISLLCEVSHDAEQQEFVWLADGVEVSNSTHNLSADGSKLFPSGACVRNYTCSVRSRLGTSSNHFYTGCDTDADKPESGGHGCTTACVIVAVLIAILVPVAIYCIQKKRISGTPGTTNSQEMNNPQPLAVHSSGRSSGTPETSTKLMSNEQPGNEQSPASLGC